MNSSLSSTLAGPPIGGIRAAIAKHRAAAKRYRARARRTRSVRERKRLLTLARREDRAALVLLRRLKALKARAPARQAPAEQAPAEQAEEESGEGEEEEGSGSEDDSEESSSEDSSTGLAGLIPASRSGKLALGALALLLLWSLGGKRRKR